MNMKVLAFMRSRIRVKRSGVTTMKKIPFENTFSRECVVDEPCNQTPAQPETPQPVSPQEVPPATPHPLHPVQPETEPQTPQEVPQPDPAPTPNYTPPHAKNIRYAYRNKSWIVRRTQIRLAVSNTLTDSNS